MKGEQGQIEIEVPRDRQGMFDPQLVKKGQTRLEGFDEKILALYARGMTTRDIQAQLQELYGVEVSPTLISNVGEANMEEVRQWQSRPLEAIYPIVYLDGLVVKIKENQRVSNKAVYLALGVTLSGNKELLGMWLSANEGAKFWLAVLTELQNRGFKDICIVCVDGLTGFPEAIESVFPQTRVQLCMVHMVRKSLRYVSHKHMQAVATDLKAISSSATEEEAELNVELVAEKWDGLYPSISKSWRAQWARVIPLFAFPADIRRVISTTNAIESLNMTLCKVTNNHRISRLMRPFTRSSTWRCATSPRSGRCRAATGSRRSIALRWSLRSVFPNDQKSYLHKILDRLLAGQPSFWQNSCDASVSNLLCFINHRILIDALSHSEAGTGLHQ